MNSAPNKYCFNNHVSFVCSCIAQVSLYSIIAVAVTACATTRFIYEPKAPKTDAAEGITLSIGNIENKFGLNDPTKIRENVSLDRPFTQALREALSLELTQAGFSIGKSDLIVSLVVEPTPQRGHRDYALWLQTGWTYSINKSSDGKTVFSKRYLQEFKGGTIFDEKGQIATIQEAILQFVNDPEMKIALDPKNSGIPNRKGLKGLVAKANTAIKAGDHAAALAEWRVALRRFPSQPEPYLGAGEWLVEFCDDDGARETFEEGLKANPNENKLRTALQALTGNKLTKDIDNRGEACEAQALNRDGVALAKNQRLKEALTKFETAARLAQGLFPKADFNAGFALEQLGQDDAAIRHYARASRSFLLQKDEEEALVRLAGAAQRIDFAVPETADNRYRVGIVRTQQKRYTEAIQEFEVALSEAPWLVSAYYNLGLVYDHTGDYQEAYRLFSLYLKLAPRSTNAGAVKTKLIELKDKIN